MPKSFVANLFLSRDEHGKPQGVQWWNWGPPTCWHGSWDAAMDGTLVINFHCMGLVYPDGNPTRMRTTLLRRQSDGPGVYEGLDEKRCKIRLDKYGSWVVQVTEYDMEGGQLVYVPTEPPRSISALWAPAAPATTGPTTNSGST